MKFVRPGTRLNSLHRLHRARASARRVAAARAMPGAVLRRARDKQGKTLAAAAAALRLPQTTIAAIERDDYARLPGPAYVLSYWRNYALLLDIDIEPSITTHKRALSESGRGARETSVSLSEMAQRCLPWGFALLSGLMLLALWHGRPPPIVSPQPASADAGAPAAAAESADPSSLRFALPEPIFSAEAENGWRGKEGAPGDAEPPQTASPAPLFARLPAAQPQPPGASPNEITLSVGQDSWIEVRDAENTQLVHRLVSRGQRLLLKGMPPFSVYIGNAGGVAVEYQGQPVQFAAKEDGLFARFNVGGR